MDKNNRVNFDEQTPLSPHQFSKKIGELLEKEKIGCTIEELVQVMSGASADVQGRPENKLREIECLVTGKFFDGTKNQWTKKDKVTPKEIDKIVLFLKTLQRLNPLTRVNANTIADLEMVSTLMGNLQKNDSYGKALRGKLQKRAKHPQEEVEKNRTYVMAYLCAFLMLRTKKPPATDSKLNPALTHASKIASNILLYQGLNASPKAIADAYHRLKPEERVKKIIELCRVNSPLRQRSKVPG